MNKNVVNNFPKKRPPLSDAHKEIFEHEYKSNRDGSAGVANRVAQFLETWMHRQVSQGDANGSLLEVGAGTLNHVPYEERVKYYDVVEPFRELYVNDVINSSKIREFYSSTLDVPKAETYDRVISVATFEHMTNLPVELKAIKDLLVSNGRLQVGIPTEGGFLWGVAWRLTTGVSYRLRTGLSYTDVMRHEHVNTESEIIELIKLFFGDVDIKRFPLPFKHLSFYTYISAKKGS
tara:strand:- start:7325 stop:8026 length:702 start_codon:yes stop_codon:yes gene_type:complete